MRANYAGGVDKYYSEHASTTYRNPHYPGILKTLSVLLDTYMKTLLKVTDAAAVPSVHILDMAAGSGEATEAILTWERKRALKKLPCPIFNIVATDPYTGPAYKLRTGRDCLPLSFADITQGSLPEYPETIDMVICSFALHLLTESSQLWALLQSLSSRARYLVVLAPHKKPTIKDEWDWQRVDPWTWEDVDDRVAPAAMGGKRGDGYEIYEERVRLRLWRSRLFEPAGSASNASNQDNT